MRTEPKDDAQQKRPLRRAGSVVLSLVNPFSDLGVIYRKGVLPTIDRVKLLGQMSSNHPTAKESLTFEQALAAAGKPIAQLRKGFKRTRAAWWMLMTVPGVLALLLVVLLLASSEVPSGTALRAALTTLVLTALSLAGFCKALVATYRLWQLETRRVSEEECGTFHHFLSESRWFCQVLTLGMIR